MTSVAKPTTLDDPYVVVHLVSEETTKDLIGPQVVDHMEWQRVAEGEHRPASVTVLLLEAARNALRPEIRRRVELLRTRAPELPIALQPYIGRLGMRRNAAWLRRRVERWLRNRRVVFHCRGESAAEWALALHSWFPSAGLVADIRGAWPEEFLYQRGYDVPEIADEVTLRAYRGNLERTRRIVKAAGSVLTVSPGMMTWLESMGADAERLHYVPCCVPSITYQPAVRAHTRQMMGLEDRFVVAYLGTITRYQHVADGVLPFFKALSAAIPGAHLLCITPQTLEMEALLGQSGLDRDRASIVSASQGDVAAHLMAADAGLILRAPSRMNEFSQPTKLGEYLAAGVPVLVARGTGFIDQLVEGAGAGHGVRAFGLKSEELRTEAERVAAIFSEASDNMRRGAVALAAREFLWSNYTDRVRCAYLQALNARTLANTD
jgi:glycosyltransferase involved in cell wall biosynthesis